MKGTLDLAVAGMQASLPACARLNTRWRAQVRLLRLNDCGNMFGKPGSFNARLQARLEHLQVRMRPHSACASYGQGCQARLFCVSLVACVLASCEQHDLAY